jgi:hypothetical protein
MRRPLSSPIYEPSLASSERLIDVAHMGAQFQDCRPESQTDSDNGSEVLVSMAEPDDTNGASEGGNYTRWRERQKGEQLLRDCKPMARYLREKYKEEGSINIIMNKGRIFVRNDCTCKCNRS